MNKVWIASILATIMLLVPISSVVGANEVVDEDCLECQPVNRVDLLRVKLLLTRLEVFTNVILSKLGHIPEIEEKCEEILDIIHSNRLLDSPIICAILSIIISPIEKYVSYVIELGKYWREHGIPSIFAVFIIFFLEMVMMPLALLYVYIYGLGVVYDCWEPIPS